MLNAEICWQAVQARDARQDGAFVYAVRSTRIFCRPSCPSRHPNREQVAFFAAPEEAARAGYRPCRRCRPTERNAQVVLVERVCELLDQQEDHVPTLAELGQRFGVSPTHLQRLFTRVAGVSPRAYVQARRAGRLREELRAGGEVTTALYDAGYGSSGRAYADAPGRLGMAPGAYRSGGAGAEVRYTTADSPLGRLLVAATGRGICFVALGDSDRELEQALIGELPAAQVQRDSDALEGWVGAIVGALAGSEPHLDLPVDVRATAFQEQVWRVLREIPAGETRTYGEIARAIGKPGSARAVGQACGSNPVALVVPCHRAVRGDGQPGGYRWGAERKRAILEAERGQG